MQERRLDSGRSRNQSSSRLRLAPQRGTVASEEGEKEVFSCMEENS